MDVLPVTKSQVIPVLLIFSGFSPAEGDSVVSCNRQMLLSQEGSLFSLGSCGWAHTTCCLSEENPNPHSHDWADDLLCMEELPNPPMGTDLGGKCGVTMPPAELV